MLKPRNWSDDAYEFCRRFQSPGLTELVKAALDHGYQLGVKDATGEFRTAIDGIKEQKERSARPR